MAQKAVDLGQLQSRYEKARANERNTARALKRAEDAHTAARKELAAAEEALAAGVKSMLA